MNRAPTPTWKRSFVHGVAAPLVRSNGNLFVSSGDGQVHALDAASGKTRWVAALPGRVPSNVAVDSDSGRPFYGGGAGVGALGLDGETLWSASSRSSSDEAEHPSKLVVVDGALIEAAGLRVCAWNKVSGENLWEHELPCPATSIASSGSDVAVSFRSFEHQSAAGGFWELGARSGQVTRRIDDVPAHDLRCDERGVVVSTLRQALAVYGRTGASLSYFFDGIRHERLDARRVEPWLGEPLKVATADDRIYLGDRDGVSALERNSGEVVWRELNVGKRKNAGCKGLVAARGLVVHVAFKTYLLEAATGTPIWAVNSPATWAALGLEQLYIGTTKQITAYPLPV